MTIRHHDLVDVEIVYLFHPKSGKSIAVGKDFEVARQDPIFLPLDPIEIEDTGRLAPNGRKIYRITMPQSLAIEKELDAYVIE